MALFPPRKRKAFHEAILDEILEERVVSSHNRINPRGVKRKMSNYNLRPRKINAGLPTGTFILSLAIDPTTPSTVYAAGGGVFKSTDGGGSWKEIDTGLPRGSGQRYFHSLSLDPTAPSTVYVGYFVYSGYKGAVYKSTDGGTSWDRADAGLTGIDVCVLAIDPVNTATVYTAAGSDVFKSVDSGASWTKLFTFQIAKATFPSLTFGADDAIARC
jgi:photosystem II stability/assembly factor-like uncharacterized protein